MTFTSNNRFSTLVSYLPFMYLYVTRLGTGFRFFQFFGGEILPITIMTYLLLNNDYSLISILNIDFGYFTLFSLYSYLIFFTVYEIGYITNDCISVQNELNPSIRYHNRQHWKYLVISKLGFFSILVYVSTILFNITFWFFVFYCGITMFLFLLHNILPLKERGLSYFWLTLLRLMLLPALVFITDTNHFLIVLLFIFPELLRRTLRYLRIK